MSSLIDASESLGHDALGGDCDSGIIHFDATQRRKEKMRQKAQDLPVSQPAPHAAAALQTAPNIVKPAPSIQVAAKPAATLAAYTPPLAPATTPVASLNQLSGAELEKFLIDFVVEQTGYPPEMVELDADLEADLGIDSIKKAQLFGELAERFEITVDVTDESLSLDDFPTLQHVMEFLQAKSGSTAAATPNTEYSAKPASNGAAPLPAPAIVNPQSNGNGVHRVPTPESASISPACSKLADVDLESFLVEFVVEQTGYPPEMVELDADLEADLGIDSIKKAQLFGELAEQFEITVDVTDESLSLDDFPTLRHVMEFLQSSGSAASSASPKTAPVAEPVAAQPVPAKDITAPSPNGTHTAVEPETSATGLSLAELETFLVNFVVEQTGYPPEMVELDADLEADLGIDSIKKAQMMGELAEQFEITVDVTDESLSLDDFPTLRHVCNFLAGPKKATV